MPDARYDFLFDPRFRPLLAAVGVTPRHTFVTVDDQRLVARFGPWTCATSRSNILEAKVTGPYEWYRAIGTRLSFVDRGLTFGSSTYRGVCILFREPVRGMDPAGFLRHPGLTVTVDDAEGLARLLS
jgi:hypothetical protein